MRPLRVIGLFCILAALVTLFFTDHNRISILLIIMGSIFDFIDRRLRARTIPGQQIQP